MTPNIQFLFGCLCGLAAAVIWGLWSVLTRDGINHHFTPAEITIIRALTSALILLPIYLKYRCYQTISFSKSLILSTAAGAGYVYTVSWGLQFVPASHVGLFTSSTMLLVSSLGGYWLLGEQKNKWQVLGYFIIISGMLTANYQNLYLDDKPLSWLGDFMLVLGGFLWASYTIFTKKWQIPAWEAVSTVAVYSALIYIPLVVIFNSNYIDFASKPTQGLMVQIIGQGVITAVIALILYTWST